MTYRRAGRPSQVRPRPPSTGRPAPSKVRPRAPAPGRLSTRRGVQPKHRFPLLVRAGLAVAVMALGVAVFVVATGGLTRAMAAIGNSVDGFLENLTATPSPRPTIAMVADAPLIERPSEPYTNLAAIDLLVTVPQNVVGDPLTRLRLYLALPDQAAVPILEAPMGATRRVVIPDVELANGANDFTATLVGPVGESEQSPIVTFILDAEPPSIALTSPADGGTVNAAAVDLVGKTQGRSTLVARNEANNASVTGVAGSDGVFKLTLPIEDGANGISITATDPAGNVGSTVVAVLRGSGKLAAKVTASTYQLSVKNLPADIELAVLVTDPDGRPLEGARVTFILTIPGIPPPVTTERETGGDGRAVFPTRVPQGATVGQADLSVFVETAEFGTATDLSLIRIVK
jgi:glucodextranase-like protein